MTCFDSWNSDIALGYILFSLRRLRAVKKIFHCSTQSKKERFVTRMLKAGLLRLDPFRDFTNGHIILHVQQWKTAQKNLALH